MHIIQQKILDLSDRVNLANLTLREIGNQIGEPDQPQKIKHHLEQLFKKTFLKRVGKTITRVTNEPGDDFYFIPVLGAANCGQAVTFADEHIEGYLTVSPKILRGRFRPDHTFAVQAIGNSMNQAHLNGLSIEEGDYVVVDNEQRSLMDYNNKYVLSVISGMANIKRLKIDEQNQRIMLLSESTETYPPIYIHSEDFSDYMVNGLITDVIKSPATSV